MAAFLIGLSRRLAARGFSPNRFQLTMARTDIANYLRLAPETVSRVLRRFQADGLLRVDRRELELAGSRGSWKTLGRARAARLSTRTLPMRARMRFALDPES